MLFFIVFKKKYEGAKTLTQRCWQNDQFEEVHIKVCGRPYISIVAGLKYCKCELCHRYFTMIF